MKIGHSIDVKLPGIESFRSKIIDIKDDYFYISSPKELDISVMQSRQSCSISYIEHDIPHKFETTVYKYSEKDIPYIVFRLPEETNIERIQRREYVRIQTDVDIAIYFKNTRIASPIITVTQDISGGGLRAVLKEELPLEHQQSADIYMVLRDEDGHYEYIYTKAETVGTHLENGVHSLSMKFLLDDENTRQKIITHCFKVQREKRKQKLS